MQGLDHIKCNLCQGSSCEELYPSTLGPQDALKAQDLACSNPGHRRYHRIVKCRGCGLVYANPRDPAGILEKYYSDVEDRMYASESKSRRLTFKRCIKNLNRYKEKGRLLDIGCYTGLFASMARMEGWDVRGLEISRWASSIARGTYNIDIVAENIFDSRLSSEGSFDVITMWDTIEHLTDPLGALKICHERLADDGMLVISTMRCEGLFYSVTGPAWPWFMRMHLFYFTVNTLSQMLKKAGFRLRMVRPYVHYTSVGYLLYKILGAAGFKNPEALPDKGLLKQAVFPVNLGDFMEVYAVKDAI